MKFKTVVYYTFCSQSGKTPKDYKIYQRKLADKILTYGFQQKFGVSYSREHVQRGAHGKPICKEHKNIYFNVSNTAGLVVCALSNMEVGVDAEQIRMVRFPIVKRCCQDSEVSYIMGQSQEICIDLETKVARQEHCKFDLKESQQQRFFQLWTLKESYIKMTGEGMYFPMREVFFKIEDGERGQEITSNQQGFFMQKQVGEYWISLCIEERTVVEWQEI